jgi:hypothetical protein
MTDLDKCLLVYGILLTLMKGWLLAIALKVDSIEKLLRLKILGRDS